VAETILKKNVFLFSIGKYSKQKKELIDDDTNCYFWNS